MMFRTVESALLNKPVQDIDDFKKVNDRYGHDIGDEVLKHVAAGIKLVMGDCQYARLGAEEFGIYLKG